MKKILFISFYWYPSGKASYHFPLKMIEYLSEKSYKISLLTVNEDTLSIKDNTFGKYIPKNLEVIKTNYFDPFVFYKKFLGKEKDAPLYATELVSTKDVSIKHKIALWVRMNLFIPDARVGWFFKAIKAGKELLRKNKFDLIITNGPPHSVHLVGVGLSKKFNVPLIPILIDPWVDIASYKNQKRNKVAVFIDNLLEKRTLKKANAAIFVTKNMQSYFINKYNFLKNKSYQLYWGYNEEDFLNINTDKIEREYKIILHAGNMYEYQNPINFWVTIKKKIEAGHKIKLKFIGSLAPNIKNNIKELGLEKYTEYMGYLNYSDVIKEIVTADYLLACTHEKRHVPGKLFEYMRAYKPIIVFGEPNNEVEELLQKSGLGKYYLFNDFADDFFDWVENIKINKNFIKSFNRREIANQLEQIIINNIN